MTKEIIKFKSKNRQKPEYSREGMAQQKDFERERPFTRWEQVRHLPDFNDEIVRDLKAGGARLRKAA